MLRVSFLSRTRSARPLAGYSSTSSTALDLLQISHTLLTTPPILSLHHDVPYRRSLWSILTISANHIVLRSYAYPRLILRIVRNIPTVLPQLDETQVAFPATSFDSLFDVNKRTLVTPPICELTAILRCLKLGIFNIDSLFAGAWSTGYELKE